MSAFRPTPAAIPYDVVKVEGGGYGAVYELLNAKSYLLLLTDGEKSPDELADMSIRLLKLIHSRKADSDIVPGMRGIALDWVSFLKDYLREDLFTKLHSLVEDIPEDMHLIHGDYHLKNIMYQNGESLLIDMDTLCHGHPIFELASMYNAYCGFGVNDPANIKEFLGIPYELAADFWNKSLSLSELELKVVDGLR